MPKRVWVRSGPKPARRAKLFNILDKVVVREQKERKLPPDLVEVQPGLAGRLQIGHRIGERKGDFPARRSDLLRECDTR